MESKRTVTGDQPFAVKVKKQTTRIKVGSPGPIAKRLKLQRGDVLEIKPTSGKGTGRVSGSAGKMNLTRTFNADITTTQSVKAVIKDERIRERGFGPRRKPNLFT